MKNKIKLAGRPHAQTREESANKLFHEVARPVNRHKRLNTTTNKTLITPSGARVPPTWTDVWITTDPKSSLQAVGRDIKNRRVYLYSAEHMGRATAAKFFRLKAFAKAFPSLIKKVRRDMKTSEDARVLYLISKTGFRIGSDSETLAAVKAFGASTLKCSHVSIDGNELSFDFTGKKGIIVRKILKDTFMAQIIAGRCEGGRDHKIFRTTDDAIRIYLSSISEDSGFTVKDFRTYLGTLTAFRKIKTMPVPQNGREFKRYRKEVGKTVAKELGNSPTIALNSYVSPEVFCAWESAPASSAKAIKAGRSSLTKEFLECIHYDQEIPVEEYSELE